MNLGDFIHSKRWKLIQNYIYSWGASVVLMGALFKLEHLPYAGVMLGVGMSIEAIIFFISAFEPVMELPDWKRIYPQLRVGDEEPEEKKIYEELDNQYYAKPLTGNVSGSLGNGSVSGGSGVGISLNDLPDEQLKQLYKSFDRLSETANGLKDITDATVATSAFVKNLNEASQSIGKVVDSNKLVSGEMEKSVKEISDSYKSAALNLKSSSDKASAEIEKTGNEFSKQLHTSAGELSDSYKKVAESISGGFKGLEKSSANYTENIDKINKNLTALNSAYELHLKGAGKVEQMVNQYSTNVGEIGKLLHSSVEETRKFNDNTKEINENIQALNKIYGRMLGALNSKK
jgi:gliding motility-associated protein GldL